MIELFHSVAARSFRPLWMLEELGLPYTLRVLPFPPRAHQRSYLDINPLGTVPFLVDGDTRMSESAAMCEYLAAKYGEGSDLAVAPQDTRFGDYLNALHFGEATLTFPQTLVLRYARFEAPERLNPQVAGDYQKWFLARLRAVEARMATRAHWCGDAFTAADVSIAYALLLGEYLDLGEQYGAATRAYWQRLKARPAYQRAHAVEREQARAQGVSDRPSPLG